MGMPLVLELTMAVGLRMALEAGVKRLFRLRLLYDGLHHPVAVLELLQVVFGVADLHIAGEIGVHEGRRLGLQGPLQPLLGPLVPVFLSGDVQKDHRDPGAGHQGGDPASHGPRAHHAYLLNHGHLLILSQSLRPRPHSCQRGLTPPGGRA
jgi:hypothetical protein